MKDLSELTLRWPGVCFNDRVTLSEFKEILRCAAGVPLLAKEEYRKRGFITPRVWEALAFGSIPVKGSQEFADLPWKDAAKR